MSTHTKGPWTVDPRGIGTRWNVGTLDVDVALASQVVGDDLPQSTRSANARLIAAAPELLDGLRAMVGHYVSLAQSGDCGFWDAIDEEIVKEARQLLARVEGKVSV